MEKKIIRITADELLAAMMYYFKFIDPADFILLSNYMIEELKKQYSHIKYIMLLFMNWGVINV